MKKNCKISVRLSGGLGNQLFQLSSALYLSKIYDECAIYLDDRFLSTYKTSRVLEIKFICKYYSNITIGSSSIIASLIFRSRLAHIFNMRIWLYVLTNKFNDFFKVKQKKYKEFFLDGYFQDKRFAEAINRDVLFPVLKKEFNHLDCFFERDKKYVALHIRRGDYVSTKGGIETYSILDFDYYRNALKLFDKNFHFFIFGDDSDITSLFAKEINGICVADLNLSLIDEFILFARCDHYVIANSTFSWWASYLGWSPAKRVISPKNWFVDPVKNDENNLLMTHFEFN
jgi:hypothetical protein